MSSRSSRLFVSILFAVLLAIPLIIRLRMANHRSSTADPNALDHYGFSLREASKESGIDFRHSSPHLDAKLNHIMPSVASMGAAVSAVDFDRDGFDDIYVTSSGEGTKNALYRNQGDGTFRDVAAE